MEGERNKLPHIAPLAGEAHQAIQQFNETTPNFLAGAPYIKGRYIHKQLLQRKTTTALTMGSKDISIDFDTRRDIRLDILNQERQEFAAEEGHHSASPSSPPSARPQMRPFTTIDGSDWFKSRFVREGKRQIGVLESLKAIATSSWLNLFYIFIPISWAFHFTNHQNAEEPEEIWPFTVTFTMSLIALVPLERSLEYGGDQISLYCGKEIGDLIIVTLNN
ncbi:sodium calcium [Lentinula edodes]|uniref:Sodium calcium n=1 Tax=Lentinula edodes TaxID=5353 RepID=A0A1Q3ECJ0_LENED|nr:sodium calcium [Lentinula edodes]